MIEALMRMMLLLVINLLSAFALAAQTTTTTTTNYTYTIPTGTACSTTINGCTFHNLTPTDPNAPVPYGWFAGGTYWTQFDGQIYQGQNAAQWAVYCPGTGVYSITQNPDGTSAAALSCAVTDATTGSPTVTQITVSIPQMHKISFDTRCGRWTCHVTQWVIDDGATVTLEVVQ